MNKLKKYKNDQPSKRERDYRLMVRSLNDKDSQVLGKAWLPASNDRWRARCREFKRMWRKY